MSNTIDPNASGLAAELLLNKVMNGQLRSESGTTITAGLRSSANELNREALASSLDAAEVKKGQVVATEYQDAVTELHTYLNNAKASLVGADATTEARILAETNAYLTGMEEKTIGFTDADATTAAAVFDGTNSALVSLGGGETFKIGGNSTLNTAIAAFTAASGSTSANLDTLLSNVNAELAATGLQVNLIEGRSALLEDVASTYADVAGEQYAIGANTTNDLLNNILT